MKLARRKFFSLVASAPIAAKAAVDASIAECAGINVTGINGHAVPPASGMGAGPQNVSDYQNGVISASKYVRLMGFPDFMERELREQSRYVYALDPDIAVKKSWSMAAKIQTQRQRNFERLKQGIHSDARRFETRSTFKKVTGWDWPW